MRLRRAVELGLFGLAAVVTLFTLRELILYHPYGVDLEIPLRAAARWTAGDRPYLPESFEVVAGPELPFLYPPPTLPLIAPLLAVPRVMLFPAWTLVCIGAGVFACRRLAMPWWIVPLVLAWPPFAEAIVGGNVQVVLFALFTAVAWQRDGRDVPFRPTPRDPRGSHRPAIADGVLSALIPAVKISQAHTWLFLLRRRPRAALLGALVVAGIAVATVPIVGVDLWRDWIGQAGASGDPSWQAVGMPLSVFIGRGAALLVTALSLVAVFFVPIDRAGAWIGVLSVIGAPSLHVFGLVFLVPAMLEIRREIALVAAFAIATFTGLGVVVGAILVIVSFALSTRVPSFAVERTSRAAALA